ncbi:family 16 glycosylhydrolase [Noviherbaspirillum sp. CPCC 100848]|uniref:Family 16 glycosylhydrolase n=1 Tax=Noviherbaspirillum album TaxID=3080276 RepID=A0ABU6JE81_9BURK|nr:family 16 glycosylhydrolase [Noviherbaspirillum sp. CPCC 100848]MEC4721952.1 family 16 glycosylhydrolase [Noviherbaspirillum sp. CPCC 100848]
MQNSNSFRFSISSLASACAVVLLTACGGGGSAESTTAAQTTVNADQTQVVAAASTPSSNSTSSVTVQPTETGGTADSVTAPQPSANLADAGTGTDTAPAPTPSPVTEDTSKPATTPVSTPASTPAPATTPAPAPAPAAVMPYGQSSTAYTLTFSDEFNSSYDTNVWNDHIWYEASNATKNYTVEDGKLKIWPQRDASGNFFNRTIDTDGKFYQTYGYFEMEAKLPYGKGTWPAFWLFNHEAGAHPYRPEIDILEAYAGGGPNSGWSDSALRPTAYAATVWPNGIEGGPHAGSKTFANLGDLSAGFHKYGVKWEPNKITFYFDGKEMYSVDASMNHRMYIILDLWYGSASGTPDDSTPQGKGNSFEVNYVRAWQFQ